jgi:hypothetical protein
LGIELVFNQHLGQCSFSSGATGCGRLGLFEEERLPLSLTNLPYFELLM